MILVKTKAESVASSPIGLGNLQDEKPTLSFSELLRGAKDSKDDKGVQNGSFILSLGVDEKVTPDAKVTLDVKPQTDKETLTSLLKNTQTAEKSSKETVETVELNPKITQNLSVTELKTLIADAKQFLKDKILDSVEYKKSETKELPKTLKGLTLVAKKFGIDVSKISLEEVRATPKALDIKPIVAKKVQSTGDVVEEKQTVSSKDTPKDTLKEVSKADVDEVVDVKVKTPKTKTAKVQVEQDAVQEVKVKEDIKETVRIDDKKIELVKETKRTPLFKAHEKVEHTTEQLVQTKQFKVEDKTQKTRADETLKLLLRGEKPSAENAKVGMTKDFSVATARVIAPSATTETSKSIESLLRGDKMDDNVVKTDASLTQDVDGLDVKIKEAKQMMKYLSQDVKTAIEDYKSPFTRVKVQLNPGKMGEVDLTVVQRGKNLHVNLSSNNAAINTLAMNATDLKTQLTNNGIQNATLNFSDSSQNGNQNSGQQNRQNERKANEEYNYFENEEQNEEIVSSLEIVVPNYA